ncbi:PTS sugar transporter subunit IIA [Paenibacillus daejeonensis]|uniref:PTS sugar transporter subunit IIA n=1 Tax=Paenibacillus daejeonensis TaxID=135193 RepID=UPI00036DD43C|nr:PTS sugar transporter subunit IIA [Paenibacillus daejeonensis]
MSLTIAESMVKLNAKAADKFEAIRIAGELLVQAGHADPQYVEKMIEREQTLSTYMGSGLAIPHGTNESKSLIKSTGLSVVQLPEGVDFGDGELAFVVVGIAALGDDHLELLTNVAMVCSDEENLEKIIHASSEAELARLFNEGAEE